MIYGTLIIAGAAWLLASAQARRSPLTVLIRASLYVQAALIWTRRYGWPAVKREAGQFAWCLDEARRREREPKPAMPASLRLRDRRGGRGLALFAAGLAKDGQHEG